MVAHVKKSSGINVVARYLLTIGARGSTDNLSRRPVPPKSYGRPAMPKSELPLLSVPPIDDTCPACKGTGSITGVQFVKRGTQRIHPPRCPKCDGTGRIPEAKS